MKSGSVGIRGRDGPEISQWGDPCQAFYFIGLQDILDAGRDQILED